MITVPRLSRDGAKEILDKLRTLEFDALAQSMPQDPPELTYAATGGVRITKDALKGIRTSMLNLAIEHGMPHQHRDISTFEGRAARLLRDSLQISPSEAAHDDVWSYLTCCWLLDIAVWRFGTNADTRRFIGDLNRNTFRRIWWRAEILSEEVDISRMGEDALVSIMERPTLSSDRRFATSIALEYLRRVDSSSSSATQLMRDVTKRLLRLTPFIAFSALEDAELKRIVSGIFDEAAEGVAGSTPTNRRSLKDLLSSDHNRRATDFGFASPGVAVIEAFSVRDSFDSEISEGAVRPQEDGFETVSRLALDIARRAGRVTNSDLREFVPITSEEARDVLKVLVSEDLLLKRGVKRGTHYILPDGQDSQTRTSDVLSSAPRFSDDSTEDQSSFFASGERSAATLRRLLGRYR